MQNKFGKMHDLTVSNKFKIIIKVKFMSDRKFFIIYGIYLRFIIFFIFSETSLQRIGVWLQIILCRW